MRWREKYIWLSNTVLKYLFLVTLFFHYYTMTAPAMIYSLCSTPCFNHLGSKYKYRRRILCYYKVSCPRCTSNLCQFEVDIQSNLTTIDCWELKKKPLSVGLFLPPPISHCNIAIHFHQVTDYDWTPSFCSSTKQLSVMICYFILATGRLQNGCNCHKAILKKSSSN